jgi:hypothetical protein
MRNNELNQSFDIARNFDRESFQEGGSPSVLDIAKTFFSQIGKDAASTIKDRYVDNPSNIPADATQVAVNLAKRTMPLAAILDSSPANSGEDEVSRQMRMGLRSSPQGYGEELVEPKKYASGGSLLQSKTSSEDPLNSDITEKYSGSLVEILKFKQDPVVAKALEIIHHMMVNRR